MTPDPATAAYQSPYNTPSRTHSYEPPNLNGSPRLARPLPQPPSRSPSPQSKQRLLPSYPTYPPFHELRRSGSDASIPIPVPTPLPKDPFDTPLENDADPFDTMDDDRYSFEDNGGNGGEVNDLVETKHFGPAPTQRQPRRNKAFATKQVKLVQGNLVLECPVPSKLLSFLSRRDGDEFTHMRYTAATCDPDEFVSEGFTLRQTMLGRETQIAICITAYNEDEVLFTRTLHAVMRNIAHLCSRSKSRVWGKDGWKKVVVVIVSDGRKKVHPRMLDALAALGVYQEGIAKNLVNGAEVKAHLYEYTTQVSLDSDLKFKGAEKGIVPVQLMFCLKERNAKKLNSHRWFFNAFGPLLSPNITILLDVGTRPGATSIYHLWKTFDQDSSVAGACGEIKAMKGKGWSALWNPLVAAQNFEYKMSNILDKPLESALGYITVLPGALSAYRYIALQNSADGHGPLRQYFKGEKLHGKEADIFTANMYLAEDRILCWELVAKKGEHWVLKYVKAATGETDVPDTVPEFISQRRRWLNGALFAAVYSLVHWGQVWSSTEHSFGRKLLLSFEFVYQLVSLLFSFFGLANFYISFYFITASMGLLEPFTKVGPIIFFILQMTYVLLIASTFVLSLGNRPQSAKMMFTTTIVGYSLIMAYTLFCALYIAITSMRATVTSPEGVSIGNNIFTSLVVSSCSTAGVYILMSVLYLDPWHMMTSSLQYFILLPSYVCTLQIYAFCNTHDISWGTKGANVISMDLGEATTKGKAGEVEVEVPSEQLDIDAVFDESLSNLRERKKVPVEVLDEEQVKQDYYRDIRTRMVLVWIIANGVLVMSIVHVFGGTNLSANGYLQCKFQILVV